MRAFFAKETVQWVVAALLVVGGIAILVYAPPGRAAKAQMRAADVQPMTEGCN